MDSNAEEKIIALLEEIRDLLAEQQKVAAARDEAAYRSARKVHNKRARDVRIVQSDDLVPLRDLAGDGATETVEAPQEAHEAAVNETPFAIRMPRMPKGSLAEFGVAIGEAVERARRSGGLANRHGSDVIYEEHQPGC